MNDVDFPVARVLEGIDAAAAAGLAPVKVNVVVKRGAQRRRDRRRSRATSAAPATSLRFIEYMDVGHTNGWRLDDVVPAARDRRGASTPSCRSSRSSRSIAARSPSASATATAAARSASSPRSRSRSAATARAPGSRPTASSTPASSPSAGTTCAASLRAGATDDELADAIAGVWAKRDDRYSELRSAETADLPKVEMSFIGG